MNRRRWYGWAGIALLGTAGLVAASVVWGGRAIEFASWVAGIGSLALAAVALLSGRSTEGVATEPTLMVSAYSEDAGLRSDNGLQSLRYAARQDGEKLVIEPRSPYLDLVRSGGGLAPLHYWHSPWEKSFEWPTLDVKVVNNSQSTVLFHAAVFVVRASRPDPRPVPVLRGVSYGMLFGLLNLGWGAMANCWLRFRLRRPGDPTSGREEFEAHFEVPFGEHATVPLAEQFAAAGVDIPLLEKLTWTSSGADYYQIAADVGAGERVTDWSGRPCWQLTNAEYGALRRRALGPFPDGEVELVGTLQYDQTEIDGSSTRCTNPITAMISLNEPLAGAPLPPTYSYHARLRSDGRNYRVVVPLSQSLAPGGSDRFLITVAADRSSVHEFAVEFRYNKATVSSGPVDLELFLSTAEGVPDGPA